MVRWKPTRKKRRKWIWLFLGFVFFVLVVGVHREVFGDVIPIWPVCILDPFQVVDQIARLLSHEHFQGVRVQRRVVELCQMSKCCGVQLKYTLKILICLWAEDILCQTVIKRLALPWSVYLQTYISCRRGTQKGPPDPFWPKFLLLPMNASWFPAFWQFSRAKADTHQTLDIDVEVMHA